MNALDQEALDRASWELQRHFGREGSIYGIKACEEIARIAIVAYGAAQAVQPEAGEPAADMLREAICPHCDFAMLPKGDAESTGCEWCDARRALLSPLGATKEKS